MSELKPCYLCGSHAEMDWSGATEISGACWQYVEIDCSNPTCHFGLMIRCNTDVTDTNNANKMAVDLWNGMTKK